MSAMLPTPLPRVDAMLLRAVARLVPANERADWVTAWEPELWCAHHRRNGFVGRRATLSMMHGLVMDAAWLRREALRLRFGGTAILCLGSLALLGCVFLLTGLAADGQWHSLRKYLGPVFMHSALASPLVVFVALVMGSQQRSSAVARGWNMARRQGFFAAKSALMLLIALLASADLCRPMHAVFPNTAEMLQVLWFVLLALIGLRWAIDDQERRCQECLRLLGGPENAGRPSCNLLEWSGTEQACRDGHGVLSVPAMETSWQQYSRWVERGSGWDHITPV